MTAALGTDTPIYMWFEPDQQVTVEPDGTLTLMTAGQGCKMWGYGYP